MTVTFYSNFLNHHQLPFSLAMYQLLGDGYKFVATEPVSAERKALGYRDLDHAYPFVLTTYDRAEMEEEAMRLCLDSDVIIHGSAPECYVTERLRQTGLLTFRYSERVYKQGLWHLFSPRGLASMLIHHTAYCGKELYMLCASGYTAGDFALVGAYPNKTYKWGYFPEFKRQDVDNLLARKPTDTIQLLWCGRFLDWKHPEVAIEVAHRLKRDGFSFHIKMIGIGEMYDFIKAQIAAYGLQEEVALLGSMTPEEVRVHMEQAHIFLFTSDYNEGWGAVLNESMNSGCAVVASHAIGAVPFILRHGYNSMVYKNGNMDDLYQKVSWLMEHAKQRESMGRRAYETLEGKWNGEAAAERFLHLAEGLLRHQPVSFDEGPCSVASRIPQWRMYQTLMKNRYRSE